MIVRGKTLINAVCANLSRWGGNYIARTHYAGIGMESATYAVVEVNRYGLCHFLVVGR